MKFKSILICASAVSIGFISCKKDGGDNASASVEGTWKFSGLYSSNVAQNIYTDNGDASKTITYSTYNTKNNTGTIQFTKDSAISTNLGYSVDTTIVAYFYDNNVLTDSISQPFQFDEPAGNSTSGYKLIGADSINFTGTALAGGQADAASPSGGHYTIVDNKMTITTSVLRDSTSTDGTATLSVHETANIKIFLEK